MNEIMANTAYIDVWDGEKVRHYIATDDNSVLDISGVKTDAVSFSLVPGIQYRLDELDKIKSGHGTFEEILNCVKLDLYSSDQSIETFMEGVYSKLLRATIVERERVSSIIDKAALDVAWEDFIDAKELPFDVKLAETDDFFATFFNSGYASADSTTRDELVAFAANKINDLVSYRRRKHTVAVLKHALGILLTADSRALMVKTSS